MGLSLFQMPVKEARQLLRNNINVFRHPVGLNVRRALYEEQFFVFRPRLSQSILCHVQRVGLFTGNHEQADESIHVVRCVEGRQIHQSTDRIGKG